MIIVELAGGLGNQMFQYAYSRSLSIKARTSFKYFFFHHLGNVNRQYELGVFNLKGTRINGLFPELVLIIFRHFHMNSPSIISGYWQSEKYFSDYEKEIREEFRFVKPLDKKNLNILKRIEKTNSVSIHIRRGDYASDKRTNQFHGVCTLSYYQKAISYIKRRTANPKFFIFSDEPEWVKDHLKIDCATFIDRNKGYKSYIDMQLMSFCKHNIIANSSFSWWGAWLNSNPDKIVIAPKKWFENNEAQKNSKDILPRAWIKI